MLILLKIKELMRLLIIWLTPMIDILTIRKEKPILLNNIPIILIQELMKILWM